MKLDWLDSEEIALKLFQNHRGVDPNQVLPSQLRQWVLDLPDFGGDAGKVSEKLLEAIQVAWREEVEEMGPHAPLVPGAGRDRARREGDG